MEGFAFVLAAAAVLFTPGPTNTLLMTRASFVGFWRSVPSVGAEAAGYSLAITGLAYVLVNFDAGHVRAILQIVCALYLAYCAYHLLLNFKLKESAIIKESHIFFATLTNPKALLFVVLILPSGTWNDKTFRFYALYLIGMIVLSGLSWITLGSVLKFKADAEHKKIIMRVSASVILIFCALIFYNGFVFLAEILRDVR
jgi:threonine/homoserine/homoserine lactone efflux protein